MNPFQNATLYTDPNSRAALFCRNNPTSPYTPAIRKIANTPQAFWLEEPNLQQQIRRALVDANNHLVVFVLYFRPHRDSGGSSAGGATSFQQYKQFIDGITAALSGHTAFIVEPDALNQTANDSQLQRDICYQCLRYAIETLSPLSPTYLDVGHPHWYPPSTMLGLYNDVGTTQNRGFSINVSNFVADNELASYAASLYAATGKPTLTDTSRNGNGSATGGAWCNPINRRLGLPPLSIQTQHIDANLWIKRPGESDGNKPPDCETSAPSAGQFFPSYAAILVNA